MRRTRSSKVGTVGAVTRGLLDRTAYYEHAVVCALAPFLHDDSGLYNRTATRASAARAGPRACAAAPAPAATPPPLAASRRRLRARGRLVAGAAAAESRKRAEREGDVIDLSDLADDAVGQDPPPPLQRQPGYFQDLHLQERSMIADIARSIQLQMPPPLHAAGCRNAACPSVNCGKMKNLLEEYRDVDVERRECRAAVPCAVAFWPCARDNSNRPVPCPNALD